MRYESIRILGEGGYGRVFLARDRELGRQVALKVLEASFEDPSHLDRFRREARVTSELQHPNIVQVYDFGDVDGDRSFIAYQFVEGRDLSSFLEAGDRISLAHITTWGAKISDALQCAHDAGVVHRDLKPANVLIREGDGEPLLCDFGVARRDGAGATVHTQEGLILGTPCYVAPEIWFGSAPGPASDQWAWAASLYELVYRQRVHAQDDPQWIWKRLKGGWRPAPPRERAGRHPDLEATLMKALAVDPARRFPDMKALGRALREGGSTRSVAHPEAVAMGRGAGTRMIGEPVAPVDPASSTRVTGRLGLSRMAASPRRRLAGGLALLVAGLGLAGALWRRGSEEAPAPPPAARAALPGAEARETLLQSYGKLRGDDTSPRGPFPAQVPSWRHREHVESWLPELVDPRLELGVRRFLDALLEWLLALEAARKADPGAPDPLASEDTRALLRELGLGYTVQLWRDMQWLAQYAPRLMVDRIDISQLSMDRGQFMARVNQLDKGIERLVDGFVSGAAEIPAPRPVQLDILVASLQVRHGRWGEPGQGSLARDLVARLGEAEDPIDRTTLQLTTLRALWSAGFEKGCEARQAVLPALFPSLQTAVPSPGDEVAIDVVLEAARQEAVLLTSCWDELEPGAVRRLDSLIETLERDLATRPELADPVAYEVLEAFYFSRHGRARAPELQPRIDRLRALRKDGKDRSQTPDPGEG